MDCGISRFGYSSNAKKCKDGWNKHSFKNQFGKKGKVPKNATPSLRFLEWLASDDQMLVMIYENLLTISLLEE